MIAVFFLFATLVITGLATDVKHYKVDSNGNKVEVPQKNVFHHGANDTHHGTNAPHHGPNSPHRLEGPHTSAGNSNVHRFIVDKKGNKIPIAERDEVPDKEDTTTVAETPKPKKRGLGGLVGGVVKGVGGVVKGVGGVVDDLGAAL